MTAQALGHYTLLTRLGEGGMGEVWQAQDERTGVQVAIKIVHPTLMSNAEVAQRARTELKALLALRGHPHVVTVLDFVEEPFAIVTEYLEGTSLADVLASTPHLPLPWVLKHFRDVVRAVAFAHARGILHRDLKPANVMLVDLGTEQAVKVLDFGLARLGDDRKLTRTGQRMGTPDFMAPEQHLAGQVDERTDIYALGVLFYALLMGEPPFAGEQYASDYALMDAHIRLPLPSVCAARPELPLWVDQAIAQATAKAPDARPASCAALLALLTDAEVEAAGALASRPTPAGLPFLPTDPAPGSAKGVTPAPAVVVSPSAILPGPRSAPPVVRGAPVAELGGPPEEALDRPKPDRLPLVAIIVVLAAAVGVGLAFWSSGQPPTPAPNIQAAGPVTTAPDAEVVAAQPIHPAPHEAPAPPAEPAPAPATSAAPAAARACPCAPTPAFRVARSCAEPARSRTWQVNDKLGGQWALKARDLTATDPEAARKLARDAIEALSCALESQPDNLRIRGDLGLAFLGAGDREGLREVHRELEERGAQPNTLAASAYLLADAACAEGKPGLALRHLDEALALKPVGTGVKVRQARRDLIAETCKAQPEGASNGLRFFQRENGAVKAANRMATAVCACAHLACAQRSATEESEKLMKLKDVRVTEADADAIRQAGERAAGCMKRLAIEDMRTKSGDR